MSNRLTFSLASLILMFGLVFVTAPAMAHLTADGAYSDANHDGLDNTDSTTPLTGSDLTAETGHTHRAAPTVTNIELVDVKIGAAKADRDKADAESTVKDTSVVLVNDVDAADDVAITKTVLTQTADAGEFRIKITFSEPVYVAAEAVNVGAVANAFADADLAESSINDVAASQAAPTVRIDALTVPSEVARDGTAGTTFLATISVPGGNLSDVPMDVWISVAQDAVYSKGQFVAPDDRHGRGNAESTQFKFTVVKTLPEDSVVVEEDETAPVVQIAEPQMLTNGKAVFTIAFDEALGTGPSGFQFSDLEITGGTATADDLNETATSTADEPEYTLSVTPGDGLVTVSLRMNSVADAAGNIVDHMAEDATASFNNDNTPPTVTITPPNAPDSDGNLTFTFNFSEDIDPATITLDRAGSDNVRLGENSDPVQNATDSTIYTVLVEPKDAAVNTTVLLLKGSVKDTAGNGLAADTEATYVVPGAPVAPVTIAASPDPINCETGSTITFTITGTTETLVAGDITVGTGWKVGTDNDPSNGNITIVPDGNAAIGVTTVTVTVKANAVGNNAATSKTFTVGPVLTILAGGYITVIRPEHRNSTHLNDPLYVGSLGVRGAPVKIQTWECMPDLTVFFGKSGAGLGGGALVVKESPANNSTTNPVAKGSVGISEIMWASDEGTIHGLTSNTMQAREQWIELHNLNNHEVKVTLFARSTNQALTTEADEIDRASNFEVGNTWEVKGQSGNSALGVDFVSMFRSKNAQNYAHGDNNGKNAGKWHVSTLTYRTRGALLASSGQLAQENLTYDFKGTPGRSNTISAANPPLRTDVKNTPIIFNEVSNRRDQTLEWIELKNVSDSAKDLRNYEISIVTAVNSETRLFHFNYGDNHVIMQPGELLLLVDTDMRYNDNHPVAVGYNVRGGTDQGLAVGDDSPRYLVTDFAEGGLPDDGEFLLILRTSKGDEGYENKKGTRDRVSDVIGYHPNLKAPGHPLYTNLWPFSVYGTARARNKIEVETVHYRRVRNDPDQGDNNKPEQIALNNAGYTGIGYKRHAQESVAHGGTPGYEDIRKNLVADISSTGSVTISEIMFDQGDGRYPQWIELYNSSATQAVNLHSEAGWRLIIENFDDDEIPVRRLTGTLNFKSSDVQTILPQQTVVVASTRARNSGSAYFDTSVVFPPTRVFSVWDDARAEFDMKRATDNILSTQGFYIELIDGKDNLSDSVGNLVDSPNRRVASTIAWPLSDVTGERTEDMERSSIIRRYREPEGGDSRDWVPYSDRELMDLGIEAEGWVAAHETDFREVRQTWFGHPEDYGSPGITGGRVLPVSLSKFRPERSDDGTVVVRWITESELNNAGFNILRSESRTGAFTKLNTQLIKGHGTTSERNTYEFIDTSAKPNVVYYYQIQDVSFDGDVEALRITHLRGNVSAAGKLTTTWGELKALQ